MAIIHCPACGRRISSAAPVCPHCGHGTSEVSPEMLEKVRFRRRQDRLYRAQNLTYAAMAMVLAGLFMWWATAPQGLGLPLPTPALVVMSLGVLMYLGGRAWLLWLRTRDKPC